MKTQQALFNLNKASKLSIALLLFAILGAIGVVLREARNEVYFLCGNFHPGVGKEQVLDQLETAGMSSYQLAAKGKQDKIVLSSDYAPGLFYCDIHFDSTQKVTEAQWSLLH